MQLLEIKADVKLGFHCFVFGMGHHESTVLCEDGSMSFCTCAFCNPSLRSGPAMVN
jgi:hypothetical protein